MSKNTTKPAAPTFAIGDRIIAQTAATLQQLATGTITDITKSGWFVIKLDDTNSSDVLANTKGKISARASSLTPMLPATGTDTPATAPEADATPAPATGGASADAPDGEAEEKAEHPMSKALREARKHYQSTKRPDGTRSADNGDAIAKELRDYEPQEVAELADKVLKVPKGTHFAKYQHLNNGQIRMNSGNRIRIEWKRANEEGDEAAILHIAKLLNLVEVDDEEDAE